MSPLGWRLGARSSTLASLYFGIGDAQARLFFRNRTIIYYSKVTRKELLQPPISDSERRRILALLRTMRLINPDPQILIAYSSLLGRYPDLRDHLPDALIAASAWAKNLPARDSERSPL